MCSKSFLRESWSRSSVFSSRTHCQRIMTICEDHGHGHRLFLSQIWASKPRNICVCDCDTCMLGDCQAAANLAEIISRSEECQKPHPPPTLEKYCKTPSVLQPRRPGTENRKIQNIGEKLENLERWQKLGFFYFLPVLLQILLDLGGFSIL